MVCRETGWEREIVDVGMMQYTVYEILSVCYTRCMLILSEYLYLVLTLDHGIERLRGMT